jgi:hypothetical protein
MHVADAVEKIDGLEHLGGIGARLRLLERADAEEETTQIATRHIVHCKVDVLMILKRVVQMHQPLVARLPQHVPLSVHVRELIAHVHSLFGELFQCQHLSSALVPRQKHFAVRTTTQLSHEQKIRQAARRSDASGVKASLCHETRCEPLFCDTEVSEIATWGAIHRRRRTRFAAWSAAARARSNRREISRAVSHDSHGTEASRQSALR